MIFPQDPFELCDSSEAAWPLNWFENFGRSAFFYVAGFREFIFDVYGPLSPSSVVDVLGEYRLRAPTLLPDIWLPKLFGASPQDVDIQETRKALNINNLTPANIRDAYSGKPVTFPAALLVVVAVTAFSNENTDQRVQLQIRFAGHFLAGFGEIYPELSAVQRIKLSEATGQISPSSQSVFEQLANGRPVTYQLAQKISQALSNQMEIPLLKVGTYVMRPDIGAIKKPAEQEKVFL